MFEDIFHFNLTHSSNICYRYIVLKRNNHEIYSERFIQIENVSTAIQVIICKTDNIRLYVFKYLAIIYLILKC